MGKDTGGQAFPIDNQRAGMTLRDWYAGQALNGMLAHPERYRPREGRSAHWHKAISEEAHEIADAMIAERNKP